MKQLHAWILVGTLALAGCGGGGGGGGGSSPTPPPTPSATTVDLTEDYKRVLFTLAAGTYTGSPNCQPSGVTLTIDADGKLNAPGVSGLLGTVPGFLVFGRTLDPDGSVTTATFKATPENSPPQLPSTYISASTVSDGTFQAWYGTFDYATASGCFFGGGDTAAMLARDPYPVVEPYITQAPVTLQCQVDANPLFDPVVFSLANGVATLGQRRISLTTDLASQVVTGGHGELTYLLGFPGKRVFWVTKNAQGQTSGAFYSDEANGVAFNCVP